MRTSLIVDTKQFRENINTIKKMIAPKTSFLSVVKADAYGHGAIPLARVAEEEGVNYFGVATIDEAIELREAGIKTPILILTEPADIERLQGVLYYNISLTVYTEAYIEILKKVSEKFQKPFTVHLKIDTGMSRVGVDPKDAVRFASDIQSSPLFNLEGIFTHLSDADNPDPAYTQLQLKRFNQIVADLKKKKIKVPFFHAANSMGTLNFPNAHYDMVRVGIALYKNVMTFKTKVIHVREVAAKTPIGYSRTYISKCPMKVAVLSVGYADGYSRLLSNRGEVLVQGQRCPIVGNVCMDMTMVHIPDRLNVCSGDDVTLIGKEGHEQILADQVAAWTETIDYEVMCSIGKRVPRIYS